MPVLCTCGNRAAKTAATDAPAAAEKPAGRNEKKQPVQYTYEIKAVHPHNTGSYTQGLYWHDGYLWEGTGEYRHSVLQKVELKTGKILERIPLENRYFGEGIALLDGRIYQLTWTDGIAFVYDAATLRKTGELRYEGEGWGLTTDGRKLYMSDGSHEIHIVNPEDFRRERTIPVRIGKRTLHEINELEWIDGRIWANVYMSDSIVIINPETGDVEGVVDLEGLLPKADRTPDTDVLNGIAYDAATGRIFVTGKNWPKLFEIEVRLKE